MSQDIEDTLNPHRVRVFSSGGRGAAGGLVVPGGVDVEFAEELAGGGVDDADVQVVDERQDAGSGVGAAGADVEQAAAGAQGDGAAGVDAVMAEPVAGVGGPVARGCPGPGLGVVRLAVLLGDPEAAQLGFQGVAAALAAGAGQGTTRRWSGSLLSWSAIPPPRKKECKTRPWPTCGSPS